MRISGEADDLMARIRTVKPEYPKHRKVRKVSRDARLLNIHLWNLADDEGRLQELPQWIIGEVFPTDEDVTPVVLREWLVELQVAGLIIRYEADGEAYIQCHGFSEHQVINKPRPSRIPAPDAESAQSRSAPVVLPDDSHPEQGTGNREQGNGNRPNGLVEPKLDDLVAEEAEDFALWQEVTDHPGAKLTRERSRVYRARRKDGYSRDRCQVAIRGAGTPQARGKDGTLYDDFRTVFRNGTNLEMYEGFAMAANGERADGRWARG